MGPTAPARSTGDFTVLAPAVNPATDSALYTGQHLHNGLNYITMRDGIKLAATVRYPYGERCTSTDPCPTVIENSGYNVAGPTDPIPFMIASFLGVPCTNCGDPHLLPDSSTYVGAVLARLSGFATVSLQMRGTGCSGGAFDLFGYPTDFDAYDAIGDRGPPGLGRQPPRRSRGHQLLRASRSSRRREPTPRG